LHILHIKRAKTDTVTQNNCPVCYGSLWTKNYSIQKCEEVQFLLQNAPKQFGDLDPPELAGGVYNAPSYL